MLKLNDVTIAIQSFGSVWAVFLTGSKDDITARHNSFWNWKGIAGDKGELDWWHDTCAMFYTYPKNFQYAMEMAALQEILNSEDTKGTNPLARAREIAASRMAEIERVTYIKKQPEYAYEVFAASGTISAEKGTGNFDDDVLGGVVSSASTHSGSGELTTDS